jgi:hypothetical protein
VRAPLWRFGPLPTHQAGAPGDHRVRVSVLEPVSLVDPTGAMRDRLDEVGAYADGCQDLGDAAKATAAEMQHLGLPADVVAFTDETTRAGPGGHADSLGPADLATLAHAVLNASAAAPAP